jgi:hypothetical protein
VISPGQLGIVANNLQLAYFWQGRRLLPQEVLWDQIPDRYCRDIQIRQPIAPASRCRTFKN